VLHPDGRREVIAFDLIRFTKQRARQRSMCNRCFRFYNVATGANRRAVAYGVAGRLRTWDVVEVFVDCGYRCQACHSTERLCVDHIRPLACGGTNTPDNLQILCFECNTVKGTREVNYRLPANRFKFAERGVA
jgi:hypothetical protein